MERDFILNGIHIGEHSLEPEKVKEEIRKRCIEPGLNMVTIRPTRTFVPQHYFVEWAKFLAENKIYFNFLYTVQYEPLEKDSMLEPETVRQICEVGGEYFMGDMIGESGTMCASAAKGYFEKPLIKKDCQKMRFDYADMKEAYEQYKEIVSEYSAVDRKLGMPDVISVEATTLHKYNAEAGITMPMLELMPGNPEISIPAIRGTARSYDSKLWGTYIAHEWYGGMRNDDKLKRKRLELEYKYAYLSGSQVFCLESGDELVESYGYTFPEDHEICRDYREVLTKMQKFINEDARPCGGPKVKVAFVHGLYDGWAGWGGASVWNQFGREEWGHGAAEHSWRILEDIGSKRSWHDSANYGDEDLSAFPAYGMYDIVPIEAPIEKLSKYDYLIFLGWNSMTDENMDKFTEYVSRGGHLLMSAAHLNYQTSRNGDFIMPTEEKLKKLFGAQFTGKTIRSVDGVKFRSLSSDERVLYPGSKDLRCDPIYPGGYKDFALFELCGGVEAAQLTDSFIKDDGICPAVVENKLGNGVATLVTSTNYPGHPALLPLYRAMVREIITASARNCDIKIIGSDRVRWSVYNGDKLYLLNTDYDVPVTVKVINGDTEKLVTLDSLELKAINL